jgi:hypothetical protein
MEEMVIDGIVPQSLKRAAKNMTSLRTLETTDEDLIEELPNHSLENLTWIGLAEYFELHTVLQSQGDSLQSLEFRCPELESPVFGLGFQAFDPQWLVTRTKNLTRLSVDIQRNVTWDWEILEQIAAVRTLRTLNLWMNIQSECRGRLNHHIRSRRTMEYELGVDYCEKTNWDNCVDYCKLMEQDGEYCKGDDQFQEPYVNDTNALELFTYMRGKKQGEELEQITFWVGDWTTKHDGPVMYEAPWAKGRRGKVTCKADTDVEMVDWCIVEEGKEYWKHDEHWPASTYVDEPACCGEAKEDEPEQIEM